MEKKFNPRNVVLVLIIVLIAFIRVFNNFSTHITVLANYSPLAAMTLFGGAYFKGNGKAVLLPLLTIFLSDLILFATVYKDYGNGFLYDGWLWVYSAFVLIALIGKFIIQKINVRRIALAIVAAVSIHWIVTDFGVWIGSKTYAQTWTGFNACLTAAIPFELRLLTATIVYSVIMFGVFELVKRNNPALETAK